MRAVPLLVITTLASALCCFAAHAAGRVDPKPTVRDADGNVVSERQACERITNEARPKVVQAIIEGNAVLCTIGDGKPENDSTQHTASVSVECPANAQRKGNSCECDPGTTADGGNCRSTAAVTATKPETTDTCPAPGTPAAWEDRGWTLATIGKTFAAARDTEIAVGVHAVFYLDDGPLEPRPEFFGKVDRVPMIQVTAYGPAGLSAKKQAQPSSGVILRPKEGTRVVETFSWNTSNSAKNVSHGERQLAEFVEHQTDSAWRARVKKLRLTVFGKEICPDCSADIQWIARMLKLERVDVAGSPQKKPMQTQVELCRRPAIPSGGAK